MSTFYSILFYHWWSEQAAAMKAGDDTDQESSQYMSSPGFGWWLIYNSIDKNNKAIKKLCDTECSAFMQVMRILFLKWNDCKSQ